MSLFHLEDANLLTAIQLIHKSKTNYNGGGALQQSNWPGYTSRPTGTPLFLHHSTILSQLALLPNRPHKNFQICSPFSTVLDLNEVLVSFES